MPRDSRVRAPPASHDDEGYCFRYFGSCFPFIAEVAHTSASMSNPFEPPEGPPPEKGRSQGAASGSNPFEQPDAPPGIPPNRPGGSSSTTTGTGDKGQPPAAQPDTMDVSIPDEPPPAYSSGPSHQGEQTVQAGPARMDFSGPPPLPDRFQNYDRPQIEQQITGVGFGYRPEPGQPRHSQMSGFAPPPDAPPPKGDFKSTSNEKPMTSQGTGGSGEGGGPSRPPPQDLSPTEIATPGRPLLRKGQLLVYPKNHYCNKCTFAIDTSLPG